MSKKILILLVFCIFCGSCCRNIQFVEKSPQLPPVAEFKHKKLALVLGGGGAKGFAHLGVLEELANAGVQPDVIIGCSAGSIVGALYADNPDIKSLKALLLPSKSSDAIELSSADWPYGLYSQSKLNEYLHKNLTARTFAELKIPFVATAVNLQHGNLTSFSEGELIQPILASAAYPGAYVPVKINDQYFVDCAVADPIPVQLAKDLGFATVIAVNISEQLPDAAPNHGFGVFKRSLEIAYINRSKLSAEQADVVIDFNFKNIGMFSDAHNQYLYEEGRKATKLVLKNIQDKLRMG